MRREGMRRIVVTGLGMITPIGVGKEEFWRNAVAGKSGIRPVRAFDTSAFRVHYGAEVIDFRPGDYVRNLEGKPIGRCSQLAIAATRLALADAGLQADHLSPE